MRHCRGSDTLAPAPAAWTHGRHSKARTRGAIRGPSAAVLRAGPPAGRPPDFGDPPRDVGRLNRRLRAAHLETILALVAAVEAKDPHTERHSVNVSAYAERLARALGVSESETEVIKTAAVLHDIGKIAVPDAVLTKPGPLTAGEFAIIKRHPAAGAGILRSATCLRQSVPLVLHHHEWYDGSGYPDGMKGERIPFGARILQVADAIDAMLRPRCYKACYSIDKVISELQQGRGTQFDPQVADVALRWLEEQPGHFITEALDHRTAYAHTAVAAGV